MFWINLIRLKKTKHKPIASSLKRFICIHFHFHLVFVASVEKSVCVRNSNSSSSDVERKRLLGNINMVISNDTAWEAGKKNNNEKTALAGLKALRITPSTNITVAFIFIDSSSQALRVCLSLPTWALANCFKWQIAHCVCRSRSHTLSLFAIRRRHKKLTQCNANES